MSEWLNNSAEHRPQIRELILIAHAMSDRLCPLGGAWLRFVRRVRALRAKKDGC